MECLHQGLFYGTIGPEAGTHEMLLHQTLVGLTGGFSSKTSFCAR
jgi:hypothetical protein